MNTEVTVDVAQLEAAERYLDPAKTRCLCHGRYSNTNGPERHLVWVCFDCTGSQSTSISPGGLGWWITRGSVLLGRSDCVHVQTMFWDHEKQQFYSYGADYASGVYCNYLKTFEKPGWRFVQLDVTMAQEVALRRALIAEVGKRFDLVSALLIYFYPLPLGGTSWICSSLAAHALHAAGLTPNAPPAHVVTPARLLAYLDREYPGLRTMLENNLVVLSNSLKRNGRQNFYYV
jgi:hypothetical protein